MREMNGAALELHAVVPGDAVLPASRSLPPGLRPWLLQGRHVALLASRVAGEADGAAALARHRQVCAVMARLGPCLPLPCGVHVAGRAPAHAWLAQREPSLARALEAVSGCDEWVITLAENAQAHGAWLSARDPGLARMERQAAEARYRGRAEAGGAMDAGALAGEAMDEAVRQLAGRLAAAHEAARQARRGVVVARVEGALSAIGRAGARVPVNQGGRQGWTVLVPSEAVSALRRALAAEARELAGTGLLLDVSEPQPAYRFARGVTLDA